MTTIGLPSSSVSKLRQHGGIMRQKPWEAIGMSRATRYRRGKPGREVADASWAAP
jgi:hypothetical protein